MVNRLQLTVIRYKKKTEMNQQYVYFSQLGYKPCPVFYVLNLVLTLTN